MVTGPGRIRRVVHQHLESAIGAELVHPRGCGQDRVRLSLAEHADEVGAGGSFDNVDLSGRIDAGLDQRHYEKGVGELTSVLPSYVDRLVTQGPDIPGALLSEKTNAAHMETRQNDERVAGVHL